MLHSAAVPDDLDRALEGTWLAARLGVDPVLLEIRRRAGELFATRAPGSDEWLYPSWQFDEEGEVRPQVTRVLAAAREAGLSQAQLEELFRRKVGLAGGQTMLDLALEGDEGSLVRAIKAAG